MKEVIIIVAIACFLYPMRNLIGLITRLFIYGMIPLALFSKTHLDWDDKLFFVSLLAIPIIVNLLVKYVKHKMFKI